MKSRAETDWEKLTVISFHLAKNTTKLKMKTINDGNTKQINVNKPFLGVDFVKSSDLLEV